MENLAGDHLLGLKFVKLSILPTLFTQFVQGRLGELRSGSLPRFSTWKHLRPVDHSLLNTDFKPSYTLYLFCFPFRYTQCRGIWPWGSCSCLSYDLYNANSHKVRSSAFCHEHETVHVAILSAQAACSQGPHTLGVLVKSSEVQWCTFKEFWKSIIFLILESFSVKTS